MAGSARQRLGWCVYDWANSAFATTILAAVLPVYFVETVVPREGIRISFLGGIALSATSLWGYASALTAILILLTAPALGGIADRAYRKKAFLVWFCYAGALFTVLLYWTGPGDAWGALLLFALAQYCFVAGNVFYDAFLPAIAGERDMDSLSGQGYALGYLGGGLLLVFNVLFIQFSAVFGVSKIQAVRLSLASAGLWWVGFGTVSFWMLGAEKRPNAATAGILRAAGAGLRDTWETTKSISKYRQVLLFLIAYMIYNDGVQTVIKMASIYGKDELGLSTGTLLGTLLMVQFIGIGGALFLSGLARRLGTKKTIMGSLCVWIGITLFAYRISSPLEYWLMGAAVGLILGGTQALSRSFYARLIPSDQSAQFFGYFSVFTKFSAIWGPFMFAVVRQVTGTSRLSILGLALFFLVGLVLLFFVKDATRGPDASESGDPGVAS